MVLGYLLYKTVDLSIDIVKITYYGCKKTVKAIELLTKRIDDLEKTLKEKND